jgi:hypothetical protein
MIKTRLETNRVIQVMPDPDQQLPIHDLVYTASTPTIAPRHNGKLGTLVSSCGLGDHLARQHCTRPFPASHIRGKNRIDYIFLSSHLLPGVQSSGCLSHYSLMSSDHRAYFIDIDIDSQLLFSDPAFEIHPIERRRL